MLLADSAFVGIHPSSGHKSFTYAALNKDLNLFTLAEGEVNDVTTFIAKQGPVTVAIDSSAGINRGLVREITKKRAVTPNQIRRTDLRMAEHELRERGIAVTKTAASVASCPIWMQAGFELYRKLEKMGLQKYPKKGSDHQVLETHSHACFCALVGHAPLARLSLEGRLQRQIILYECGVRIKDPMDFFEEITRYKIAKGIWPTELLYLPDQLDALAAAYTAWLATEKQGKLTGVGDEREGRIILPVTELKDKY
jgi:predicted RNA binding protein YcfA (HicA-like mRNA interferase family)